MGSIPVWRASYPKLQFDVERRPLLPWVEYCLSTSVEKVSGCGLPQPAWDSSLRGRSIGLKNRRMVDRYHSVPPDSL